MHDCLWVRLAYACLPKALHPLAEVRTVPPGQRLDSAGSFHLLPSPNA